MSYNCIQRESTASGDCPCKDMNNVSENVMNEECFVTLYIIKKLKKTHWNTLSFSINFFSNRFHQ